MRPLLSVRRTEVQDFLRRRTIVPYDDPSNHDASFARVRVRTQILPAFERDRPGITRRIYAAALKARALHDQLSAQAVAAIQSGGMTRRDLAQLPEPLAAEVLKLLYIRAGGVQPGLSRSHVASMIRLAHSARGGSGVDLPGALRLRIVGDEMQVVATAIDGAAHPRENARLEVRTCFGCSAPDAAHLRPGLDLHLGLRQPGLRMRPVGGRGSRKLQDIFVDARVPREERASWPLVFASGRLAWVPGIAVDADLASRSGQPAMHVAITPMPVRSGAKVASLGKPNRLPGVLS